MQKHALGQDLFDQIVRTIGLREVWYFGIQYIDKDGNPSFLRLDKKITSNDFASGSEYDFKFMVKFYPENVEEELIQTCTITHFYLQVGVIDQFLLFVLSTYYLTIICMFRLRTI